MNYPCKVSSLSAITTAAKHGNKSVVSSALRASTSTTKAYAARSTPSAVSSIEHKVYVSSATMGTVLSTIAARLTKSIRAAQSFKTMYVLNAQKDGCSTLKAYVPPSQMTAGLGVTVEHA